jgi:hypothetical protein
MARGFIAPRLRAANQAMLEDLARAAGRAAEPQPTLAAEDGRIDRDHPRPAPAGSFSAAALLHGDRT